ncbi:protein N-lysine methyltransferase METTL21A isoform X2 [Melanerpes formicivorus]|uniref:protein N-lysine methyltransferase METTL21A isoform X2 n=1 Tax=Melanerpes formicivorus TaxID=211600 RepID=UPI00358EDE32
MPHDAASPMAVGFITRPPPPLYWSGPFLPHAHTHTQTQSRPPPLGPTPGPPRGREAVLARRARAAVTAAAAATTRLQHFPLVPQHRNKTMLPWPSTTTQLQGIQKLLAEEGNHSPKLRGALPEQPFLVHSDACSPVRCAPVLSQDAEDIEMIHISSSQGCLDSATASCHQPNEFLVYSICI